MQRHDSGDDVPDTNVDLLNENRGVEPTDDDSVRERIEADEGRRRLDPDRDDEIVATPPAGGQSIAVAVEEVDEELTDRSDRDQADDARLERERAR
jgi:hypothetical protein